MKEWAYRMRSPSGASEETFIWWYKNVSNVIFREETMKYLRIPRGYDRKRHKINLQSEKQSRFRKFQNQ
jgi:hypothetical protein